MTADERLARAEGELRGLRDEVRGLRDEVRAIGAQLRESLEQQAEMRGALSLARVIATVGGATGLGGLAAWATSLFGGVPPSHQ